MIYIFSLRSYEKLLIKTKIIELTTSHIETMTSLLQKIWTWIFTKVARSQFLFKILLIYSNKLMRTGIVMLIFLPHDVELESLPHDAYSRSRTSFIVFPNDYESTSWSFWGVWFHLCEIMVDIGVFLMLSVHNFIKINMNSLIVYPKWRKQMVSEFLREPTSNYMSLVVFIDILHCYLSIPIAIFLLDFWMMTTY